MKIKPLQLPRIYKYILLFILAAIIWFCGFVEESYYEGCCYCDSRRVTVETRLFGFLISQYHFSEQISFEATLGEDLKRSCPHSFTRDLIYRRYGLIIPMHYRHYASIMRPKPVPDWYKNNKNAIITGLESKSPHYFDEFQENVFVKHDAEYMQQIIEKMSEFYTHEDCDAEPPKNVIP